MALIANARRFSPESARQMRLSTHYLGTEDRYFDFCATRGNNPRTSSVKSLSGCCWS